MANVGTKILLYSAHELTRRRKMISGDVYRGQLNHSDIFA